MSILALTADTTATASGVLNDVMISAVQSGMDSLVGTVGQVLAISVPAAIGVIALTAGVKYALKKVKGVISMAA